MRERPPSPATRPSTTTGSTTWRWTEPVPDDSPAAAACALAHAAVHPAVEHARSVEVGAGPNAAERADGHDEPARGAQLARWHADDEETVATDSTAETDDEWAWSA